MNLTILSIFPDFFQSPFQSSMLKRAQAKDLVRFSVVNIRDFATDPHQMTDDRPYGGGAGMVMKVEPIAGALASLPRSSGNRKVILTSAKGTLFSQQKAVEYAKLDELVIICGHYEGVDERVAEHLVDEEVRIGDFVLTGGEAASLVIVDAVTRLIPGVLGNEASTEFESHTITKIGAHPQYTRPENFSGWKVPEVLLTGNHKDIETWRKTQRKKL